ncbi:MAG: mechanosensitive ion channel [Pseudanabaenaceae cyanobacterium bins.68]|nr:mechanosensitive ion channel [Pseudanabaenaceae cyanobacterium bins.68]
MLQILRQLEPIITTPIFSWGKAQFSLYTLFSIAIAALVIALSANFLSRLLKRSLSLTFKLDRGTLESTATIANYCFLGLGTIIFLQTIGVDLSSLAVFAGVLGIGFGLGVQNFTSSFVSSLVILFEQTIKVGDYIEVEGLAGTVEKISIRSTLIRTVDDIFVIVPNLQLIANKTINWSYGGHKVRIHLPIVIAYHSDPLLVTEALLEAARSDSRVMSQPEPEVWLKGMGEHGLQFDLLVWINQPELSMPIKSTIYFRLEQELRLRQIEIPFPQLDLHIKERQRSAHIKPKPTEDTSAHKFTRRSLAELLRQVTYFQDCNETQLRSLIASGYRQTYQLGEFICHQDEPSNEFYIILSGSVQVISMPTGQILAELSKGEFFGEISLLMGIPRTATVKAIAPTTVFVIGKRHLQQLMQNYPQFSEQIALKLSERKQALIESGILQLEGLAPKETAVFDWVRSRLSALFNI